jgi:hypothetical protein
MIAGFRILSVYGACGSPTRPIIRKSRGEKMSEFLQADAAMSQRSARF